MLRLTRPVSPVLCIYDWVIVFTNQQRRWRLAERHRLTEHGRSDSPVTITQDLVALHSSDPATVYLAALARMKRPSIAAIEHALYTDRTLVRHHAMRRTLWVMTPDIARLAHGAATLKVARSERKRTIAAMRASTDIDDPDSWLTNALGRIIALIDENGPLTTRAIGEQLPDLTVPVTFGVNTKHPAAISAHTKVLQGAGFDAALVRTAPTGSWISSEYLWAATTSWLRAPIAGLEEADAAGPLLDLWLQQFGPATETDIRWWFGWTATLTRTALLAADALTVQLETGDGFVATGDTASPDDPGPWVRLLPGLDPTAMGWKERDWYVNPALVPRLFDRFGNVGPSVWVDGEIAGGWIQRPTGDIAVELATGLDTTRQTLLDEAIEELSTALGDTIVRPRFPSPVQKDLYAFGPLKPSAKP